MGGRKLAAAFVWSKMIHHPPVPTWFFFPTDQMQDVSAGQRLKTAEDEVRKDFELRDRLYQLVAYKFLYDCGYRISTIDAEIRREVKK